MTTIASQIIAHRGFAGQYPENSLLAIKKALQLGVKAIEVDIQFCADQVPVLLHDISLSRTASIDQLVTDMPWSEARLLSIGENERLDNQFNHETLPSLSQLVSLIGAWPDCRFFIEIKEESFEHWPAEELLDRLLLETTFVQQQCVFICYDPIILQQVKQLAPNAAIGLVLRQWAEPYLTELAQLQPNYCICNYQKIPTELTQLPHDNIEWAFYEVTDPAIGQSMFDKGATWLETMEPERLIQQWAD